VSVPKGRSNGVGGSSARFEGVLEGSARLARRCGCEGIASPACRGLKRTDAQRRRPFLSPFGMKLHGFSRLRRPGKYESCFPKDGSPVHKGVAWECERAGGQALAF
jgi:hypothetical protein